MTNLQCYSYGAKAIDNLLKNDVKLTHTSFWEELYYLWDIYSEEHIEEFIKKEEFKGNLF